MMNLKKNVGEKITIRGEISNIMWQHFGKYVEGYPHENYIDLDDNTQIVVYTKKPIKCKGLVELIGEVIAIDSSNNEPESKIHDGFIEYQLVVDSWKCL